VNTKINELQPKNVFKFFKQISEIPHASKDMQRISDYCVEFAKNNGLEYIQDEHYNVIIKKPASKGYEHLPAVIIQGHLDMVAEKLGSSDFDFSKDALQLEIDGDFLYAKDTTLGGDDGIAIAYALAILEDDSLKHPAIEAVFTIDEEIGLIGANLIDTSSLQGKYLLNIDSEEEGILLTSCAGGISVINELEVETTDATGVSGTIKISGLIGGHSGVEIQKGRANANKIAGDIILRTKDIMYVVFMDGGKKDNAICREARIDFVTPKDNVKQITDMINEIRNEYISRYEGIEDSIEITVEFGEVKTVKALTKDVATRAARLMFESKNGVVAMSKQVQNLVETSLNIGVLTQTADKITIIFSVRSSIESEKMAVVKELNCLATSLNINYVLNGDYPGWAYKEDSKLREIMSKVYKDMYNEDVTIDAIHAGLECGLFVSKIPGLDAISFGPNIYDIHTPMERLSVSSTKRVYEYIIAVLEAFNCEEQ